jgi:hypothetical protein
VPSPPRRSSAAKSSINHEHLHLIILAEIALKLVSAQLLVEIAARVLTLGLYKNIELCNLVAALIRFARSTAGVSAKIVTG